MSASSASQTDPPRLAGGSPGAYVRLLRANPGYRRFWLAGVISQGGDWFNYIAIFVLLTRLTGSGEAVSWFLIAKFLPSAVLGPLAGVVADRFRRKTILVLCDLARCLLVLCYLLAGRMELIWLIYLLAFVQESLWTFSHPARQASVPDLCRPEELNVANGLSGSTWSMMLAMGAALGGFVTAMFGWQTAILVDAGSFLVSARLLYGVALPPAPGRGRGELSLARLLGLAFFISSCAYLLFSQAPGIVSAALCVFLGHVGGAIQWVFSTTLLHHRVEARFRGRVFAAEMTLLTLVLSLSSWLTGLSLDRGVDPRLIVLCLALLFLLPGTLWVLYLRRSRNDRA